MRHLLLVTLLAASPALAQTSPAPQQFRLVTPHGPGSITVNTAGWTILQFVLYDHGNRAILFLENNALNIAASYILENDPTFDYNKESCKNDVLGSVLQGALRNATVKNKANSTRVLPSGQTLDVGSYFIAKNEGLAVNQQNVFGFIAQNHTCAEIHLSRTPFTQGEDHLFDSTLDSFTFDPAYAPTSADYAAMAALLPPGMAAEYHTAAQPSASASTDPLNTGQSLTLALPIHPGFLHMDAPNFVITELSAKPNGREFGIRAKDNTLSGAEALAFLFLPEPPQPTAVACRDWMLSSEKAGGVKDRKIIKAFQDKSDSGVPIALVDYEQTKAPPHARYVRRFFVAQGDLCADVAITAANVIMAETASSLYKTAVFDPTRTPDYRAKVGYATVLYDHKAYAAAAPLFEAALALLPSTAAARDTRRILIDQASMAYGQSGDLKHSRALNDAAILQDPDYPLFYYNLACADAEAGDANGARAHLQQAVDRRANMLHGESFPQAIQDDSFLKLKNNKAFWAFVESLPAK